MNNEIRCVRHGIDFVDRRLQSSGDVRIGWFVKPDVAVADLDKAEVRAFAGIFVGTLATAFCESPGYRNATTHGPDEARARPCHALQESAAINSIVVEVLQILIDKIYLFVGHLSSVICDVQS